MDPDIALFEQWRAGDQRAGHQLFSHHFASIYRFFENKIGADADDLVQRTFLACVAVRDQFRCQSSFRTYLFAIARNELYAHLRRQARDERLDFETTSIAEIATSPSSRLDRARQVDALRTAVSQLPVDHQVLLELHYWHELDAVALGEVFETPAGTIRVRLLRARRALRDRMAARGASLLEAAGEDPLAASLLTIETE